MTAERTTFYVVFRPEWSSGTTPYLRAVRPVGLRIGKPRLARDEIAVKMGVTFDVESLREWTPSVEIDVPGKTILGPTAEAEPVDA